MKLFARRIPLFLILVLLASCSTRRPTSAELDTNYEVNQIYSLRKPVYLDGNGYYAFTKIDKGPFWLKDTGEPDPGATGFTRALPNDSQSINPKRLLEAHIILEHTDNHKSFHFTAAMMCVIPTSEFLPV
jgi:hypothetical protein